MSDFERRYVIDNSRGADGPREKHHTIELSDIEHRERLTPKVSKDIETPKVVINEPSRSIRSPKAIGAVNKKNIEKAVKKVSDKKGIKI